MSVPLSRSPLAPAVSALRRRMWGAALLGGLLRHGAAAVAVLGGVALCLRVYGNMPLWHMAWRGLGLLVPVWTAARRARRYRWSRRAAAAWLDAAAGGDGALVASWERGEWDTAAEAASRRLPPLPALRVERPAAAFAGALAFALAALLVPVPRPAPPVRSPALAEAVAALDEAVAALDEAEVLSPAEVEELQERLDGLLAEAGQGGSEVALEAADALTEALEARAVEGARALSDAANALEGGDPAGMEAAAAALAAADLPLPPALQEALVQADAGVSEDLAEALASGGADAPGDAASSPSSEGPDAAAMEALSQAIAEGLEERLGTLVDAGLVPDGAGEPAAGEGGESGAVAVGGEPGSGGPTRGGGPAALRLGAEIPTADARFAPLSLPRAGYADAEHLGQIGVRWTTPAADARAEVGGDAAVSAGAGGVTWRRQLAPRHREAVGTFFGGQVTPTATEAP